MFPLADLCILHPRNQWPLESAETDKHYRNAIVKELLKLCLDVNAIDILKKLIFYVVENDLDISVGTLFALYLVTTRFTLKIYVLSVTVYVVFLIFQGLGNSPVSHSL